MKNQKLLESFLILIAVTCLALTMIGISLNKKAVPTGPGHLVCPSCHRCIGHVTVVRSTLAGGEDDIIHEHEDRLEKAGTR